ncbi:MAG TPA: sigma-70 family RNA polymerase sigma factor [Solirubrobacteraceae bacterium]
MKSTGTLAIRARAERHLEAAPSSGFRPIKQVDRTNPEAIDRAVIATKNGDMDAVRFLYVRYKDNVYGYVLSIVRESCEAEDVTQQVFMKLMASIQKYEQRSVPFTAWILRVARNVAIDHLRQRRSVTTEEVPELGYEGDESSRDRRWGLQSALSALPKDQREVVVLRHLVGLSPGEIADRIGRSESSIHGLHHRGRQALKRELIELDCAPAGAA